jgi:hypothetical protein
MLRKQILQGIGIVLLGAFGMGLFELGYALYFDLRFLHLARITAERQASAPAK